MDAFMQILALAEFPAEAAVFLEESYRRVTENTALTASMQTAADKLFTAADSAAERAALSGGAGLHPYTADLLVLLHAHIRLREVYRQAGYSEALFTDTLADLRYKLFECRQVYGFWGNFVFFWYPGFFDLTRFKLGRLQYEPHIPQSDWGGLVEPGVPILKCHIPASGPMPPESVLDSLEKAYRFYGYTGTMAVYCGSWLLYPPHYSLYPEGSNLQKFYDLFTVFGQKEQPSNPNAWRVFGTLSEDPGDWPQNTRLQQNFHRYLSTGNPMGFGKAVLFYTPEKGVFKKEVTL